VPLTKKQYAIVDADIYKWIMQVNWCVQWNHSTKSFYAATQIEGKYGRKQMAAFMHDFIGRPANGLEMDHKNRDTLDNRRSNLREGTHKQNVANSGPRNTNKCGFKGVYTARGRWYSTIRVDSKSISLGGYGSAKEAAIAYDEAALRYFGEFAYLNFPHLRPRP
jgi:hypothetical protein